MLIHILHEPDIDGHRAEDDVDEALLVKTEGQSDNEEEHVTWVEYRFRGSEIIVHRSCHVTKKRWPSEMRGVARDLMQPSAAALDAWARTLVDGLVAERQRTGQPIAVRQQLTPEELYAVQHVLASMPGTGSASLDEDRRSKIQ